MKDKRQFTKKQHYIPRVYLQGFSPDYYKRVPERMENRKRVWRYDIGKQQSNLVDVGSICFEENLYEFRGANNTFVYRNFVEKFFSKLERDFSIYRKSIEVKLSRIRSNKSDFLMKESWRSGMDLLLCKFCVRQKCVMRCATL